MHLAHVGFLVRSLPLAMKFYRDVLGFKETWRGSASGKELSWVNMRVPDGEDYVEFMLYSEPPDERQRGVKNHLCLIVANVEKAVAVLQARAVQTGYARPIDMRVGTNRKRQANVFDPDGTRIELMESNTVDGKPVPSSTAPPPPSSRQARTGDSSARLPRRAWGGAISASLLRQPTEQSSTEHCNAPMAW